MLRSQLSPRCFGMMILLLLAKTCSSSALYGGDVLDRLEEKLRILDDFSYSMKLSRLDFTLEQLTRKIENIESKLSRFEVKLELRLEKMEETILGKDIKEEFTSDQLTRQIDNIGDKIANKMSFLEVKVGLKMDTLYSRLERSERHLQNSIDSILEKIGKTDDKQIQAESRLMARVSKVDEMNIGIHSLKIYVKEELTEIISKRFHEIGSRVENSLQKMEDNSENSLGLLTKMDRVVHNANEHIESIDKKMRNISCESRSRHLGDFQADPKMELFTSQTNEKLHNLTNAMNEALRISEKKFKELDNDVEIYTKKVFNAYKELLRGSQEMEEVLMDALEQGNNTRLIVKDGFRKISLQMRPLTSLEPKIKEIWDSMEKKITDLSTTVDESFAALLVAQNTFISSCHRIQQEEPQIEHKIYDTVQQIVKDLQSRFAVTDTDAKVIQSFLEDHNTDVGKALNDIVWTILNVGNQTKENLKIISEKIQNQIDSPVSCNCKIQTDQWEALIKSCQTASIPTIHLAHNKPFDNEKFSHNYTTTLHLHGPIHDENLNSPYRIWKSALVTGGEKDIKITETKLRNKQGSQKEKQQEESERQQERFNSNEQASGHVNSKTLSMNRNSDTSNYTNPLLREHHVDHKISQFLPKQDNSKKPIKVSSKAISTHHSETDFADLMNPSNASETNDEKKSDTEYEYEEDYTDEYTFE